MDDLSTLISWDELTRSADLISAKHILFVIDACYGGVALSRSLAGSYRFVKDVASRFSRQVLTAGKADEVVADSGGPRPGHSIFTGHLLDALDGNAMAEDGVLTANRVMAYVYDKVATDTHSAQTPHHGHYDGDGDLIFDAPFLHEDSSEEKEGSDLMFKTPSSEPRKDIIAVQDYIETLKELLSEDRFKIRLFDFINSEIRLCLENLEALGYSSNAEDVTAEDFQIRVKGYEDACERIIKVVCVLGYWASASHLNLIDRILHRISERDFDSSGKIIWINLNYYPLTLICYAGGISALASRNYEALKRFLLADTHKRHHADQTEKVIYTITQANLELERATGFKLLPGYGKFYAPRSEYLFKSIQPHVEDAISVGRFYEQFFDEFEIYYAYSYADIWQQEGGEFWGAPGRFAWKEKNRSDGPLRKIYADASIHGTNWPPINAGIFTTKERFEEIHQGYLELIDKLNWY